MPALITSAIPSQNFELIRDRIGEILLLELTNQHTITPTYPNITKVWIERFIPFDANLDMPTVVVSIDNSGFDNKTQVKRDGTTTYNIDIYTNASTSAANGPGDQYAMVQMNKIAGMIAAILSAPAYTTLLFANGKVGGTMVKGFFVGDKRKIKDALSDVIGRMIFEVRAIETNIITATPVPLERATTTIKLNTSDFGFYYDFDPVE